MSSGRLNKPKVSIPGSDGCTLCFQDGERRWSCACARVSTSRSYILKGVKTPFWCAASWNEGKNEEAIKRNYF